MLPRSLSGRLLVGLGALLVATVLGLGVAAYLSTQARLLGRLDDQLKSDWPIALEGLVESHPDEPGPPIYPRRSAAGVSGFPVGTYAALYVGDGLLEEAVVGFLGGPLSAARPDAKALTARRARGLEVGPVPGDGTVSRYETLSVPVASRDGRSYRFYLAVPLTDVDMTLRDLTLIYAGICLVALVAAGLSARGIIVYSLRPLDKMASTAATIATGDLAQRVEPATTRTEIGRLGVALNEMLSQIERAFRERERSEERLRQFIADASHELRTPLTSILGYAQMLRLGAEKNAAHAALARQRIEAEAQRMARLVEDLLLLARLDQRRALDGRPVDVGRLVREVAGDAVASAPTRSFDVHADGSTTVIGDADRLRQVFANLLRNAVAYTPVQTGIAVNVEADSDWAIVAVIDHGPGVSEGERRAVFERFFRREAGRGRESGGTGLGLSIAEAIVTAHGGSIELTETPGGGATFTVRLPMPATRVRIPRMQSGAGGR